MFMADTGLEIATGTLANVTNNLFLGTKNFGLVAILAKTIM